jgi:polar amino acid transport system substrate-binding protein
VGYIINPPILMKDPNSGQLSGIYYDAVEAMGKNLGLKMAWAEETGWGTMVEGIESGRFDMVVGGIWPSSLRGKRVIFSRPLFYSALFAYVRSNEDRFQQYADLNAPGVTIATLDGEMTSIIAANSFPAAKTLSHTQETPGSQLLLDVVSRKADVTFLERAYGEEFLAKNPASVRPLLPHQPLRFFGNTIVLPMEQEGFVAMINSAIGDLLASGEDEVLLQRYEKYPDSFLRVAKPFRTTHVE